MVTKTLRALACAAVLAAASLAARPASAATVTFNLDREFSGATPPAGTSPWVTATVNDLAANTVSLTISTANLTGTEFLDSFYFNTTLVTDSAFPSFSIAQSAVDSAPSATVFQNTGLDFSGGSSFKADGDGSFDFKLIFPNSPPGDRFVSGLSAVFTISATGLDATDFIDLSRPPNSPPNPNKNLYVAAHIQSIGANGNDSGWITGGFQQGGGGPTPVPLPASAWAGLALIGGFGVSRVVRQRRLA
jgi:hypothetical protein